MENLTLLPRKPKENNREYSYRVLRYNIMTLVLVPGATINENEIAEQLGTSRTPVHEALSLLRSEHLVDIVPQSGSRVSYISLRNVREGLFLRNTIEPPIYRQLAGNLSSIYLQQMSDNLAAAEAITLAESDSSIDQYIKLDDQFHKIAYMAAEKPIIWNSMCMVCSHFERIRFQEAILIKQNLSHIHGEHIQLYNFLLLGGSKFFDLDDFYSDHLSYFKSYFPTLLSNYPEYFIKD